LIELNLNFSYHILTMAINFPTVSWANGANIYEVNIRQYTIEGTFNAFAKHLPRLKDMGIDILWLMPITPISVEKRQGSLGSYYACSSYTFINPEYGNVNYFKNLIYEAHALGFKVIIDWVANHTGYDHHWTKEHPEFYVKDEHGNFTEKNGWTDVIDVDYSNIALQNAMIEAMQFWVKEYDIDGFRCDMAHLVPLTFWQNARTSCDKIKKLFWLAECDVTEYHKVFDVSYAWQWMHITEKYFKQEAALNDVYKVLHQYNDKTGYSKKLFFTTNHDENSWNGTEYEKYGEAAKTLAVLTFTWNGMPLIYSGQENPNFKRLLFFDKDVIQWNEKPLLHDFYKTLIAFHKTNAITIGETFILPTQTNHTIAFIRMHQQEIVLVLLNLSNKNRVQINVEHESLANKFINIFSGVSFLFNRVEQFELQAYEYRIYQSI